MDTMSVQEAARYLSVTEKTIYRYLDKRKLSSEKIGLVHFIPRSEVEAMAISGHVQTDVQTHERDRVNTLYELVGALDFRLRELEEQVRSLKRVQTHVQTPQEAQQTPVHSAPSHTTPIRKQAPTAPRTTSQGNIPAGTIPLKDFLHGMSPSSAKRNVEMETGDWRAADGHVINRVLNAEQRQAFWEWAHNRPGFVACPGCPHTV